MYAYSSTMNIGILMRSVFVYTVRTDATIDSFEVCFVGNISYTHVHNTIHIYLLYVLFILADVLADLC